MTKLWLKLGWPLLVEAALLVALALLLLRPSAAAQEVETGRPGLWLFGHLSGHGVSVYVVDTPAACLYVVHGYSEQDVVSVPRASLPRGKGCQ